MRYRLAGGERSTKYSPGQFVSAEYAERYPDKVKRVKRKRRHAPPLPPEPIDEGDVWELTAYYEG